MTSNRASAAAVKPIEYLAVGHVTKDITPNGPVLGGTVSYAALTAAALGLKVGIITSYAEDFEPQSLKEMNKRVIPAANTTTFENIYTPNGRVQRIHHQANPLNASVIPLSWKNCPIIHLGPVANEISSTLAETFPNAVIGITPQGLDAKLG